MNRLALPLIFANLRSAMLLEAPSVSVVFGKRERGKQINVGVAEGLGGRVCVEPGADKSAGAFGPPRFPGRNPRPLFTWLETAHVYVWGYDNAAPNDELAQYTRCRLICDAVLRNLYLQLHGTEMKGMYLTDPEWVYENIERTKGYELRFTLTVPGFVPDEEFGLGPNEFHVPVVGEPGDRDDQIPAQPPPADGTLDYYLNDELDGREALF